MEKPIITGLSFREQMEVDYRVDGIPSFAYGQKDKHGNAIAEIVCSSRMTHFELMSLVTAVERAMIKDGHWSATMELWKSQRFSTESVNIPLDQGPKCVESAPDFTPGRY